ncbi:MAG: hypothetical protein ACK4RZ_14745 [Paracoccaceae bacterium]
MSPLRTLACALCLMPFAGATFAQTGDPVDPTSLSPVDRMNMAVASHVFETLSAYEGMIARENILRLAIIAKQKVVSLSCDGYPLDEARFNIAMNDVIGSLMKTEGSEDGAITLPFMIAYSGFTTLLGGNLAVAAYDPAAICAEGATLRDELSEEGGEGLRIWAD